jgi:ankyrin repeat protein
MTRPRCSRLLPVLCLTAFAGLHGCSDQKSRDLSVAVGSNNFESATRLIRSGGDVNARFGKERGTMLMALAGSPDSPAVQFLLDNKAEVNLKDLWGVTATMYAAMNGRIDNIHALIAAGADVNAAANDGSTALSIAKAKGFESVVSALLAAGAKDVAAQDLKLKLKFSGS